MMTRKEFDGVVWAMIRLLWVIAFGIAFITTAVVMFIRAM